MNIEYLGVLITLLASAFFILSLFNFLTKRKNYSITFSKASFCVIIIMLISLLIRLSLPARHYLHNDELFVVSQAKQFLQYKSVKQCDYGDFENNVLNCYEFEQNGFMSKIGYPVILAMIFSVAGSTEVIAFLTSMLFGILCIPFSYLIGKKLHSIKVGVLAASLVAFSPELVWVSTTTNVETSALFFTIVGLCSFVYSENSNKNLFFIGSISLIIAASIRYDLVIVNTLLLLFFWLKKNVRNYLDPRAWISVSLIILLFTNLLLFSNKYFKTKIFDETTRSFGLDYLLINTTNQLGYHINTFHLLTVFILIFVLVNLLKNYKHIFSTERFVFNLLPLFLFIQNNSFIFSGYPTPTLSSIRLLPLVTTLWLIGLSCILKINITKIPILLIVFAPFVYFLFIYNRFAPNDFDLHYFYERESIADFQKVNPKCLYISDVAYYEIYNGYSSISYDRYLKNQKKIGDKNYDCVVFIESMRCGYPFSTLCSQIKQAQNWQVLNQRFVNYYILGKKISVPTQNEYVPKSLLGDKIPTIPRF